MINKEDPKSYLNQVKKVSAHRILIILFLALGSWILFRRLTLSPITASIVFELIVLAILISYKFVFRRSEQEMFGLIEQLLIALVVAQIGVSIWYAITVHAFVSIGAALIHGLIIFIIVSILALGFIKLTYGQIAGKSFFVYLIVALVISVVASLPLAAIEGFSAKTSLLTFVLTAVQGVLLVLGYHKLLEITDKQIPALKFMFSLGLIVTTLDFLERFLFLISLNTLVIGTDFVFKSLQYFLYYALLGVFLSIYKTNLSGRSER